MNFQEVVKNKELAVTRKRGWINKRRNTLQEIKFGRRL